VNLLKNPWLGLVARIIVGGIFIYASWDKLLHPDGFARIVFNYHLVPSPLINVMAIALPWIEMVAGVCLVIGVWPRSAGLLLAALTVVFIIALSINWFRGVSIECGCFTVSSDAKSVISTLIARDVGLLLLAIQATFFARPMAQITARD
jgi:cobalt-zinc-cadmium efflux system protein